MKKQWLLLLVFVMPLIVPLLVRPQNTAATTLEPNLIITEIKPHNDSSGLNEFIEIYNYSSMDVSLKDYELVYFNIHNPSIQVPISSQILEDIELGPYQYFVLARNISQISDSVPLLLSSSLKDDEGSIQLLGPDPLQPDTNKIYDQVNWFKSGASKPLPSGANEQPAINKSLQRVSFLTTVPVVFVPDWQAGLPTPFSYLYIPTSLPTPQLTCEGIIINEILPNPAGDDADREFIELYNPTDEVISLQDCSLQTSANSKRYSLDSRSLQPGEYLRVDNEMSGLTLFNSSGGTVWLLSPTEELQSIIYPINLDDDQSWARFNSGWQTTYSPTSGQANILLPLKPCPVGQERSQETGLCRDILGGQGGELIPCREGQERNSATNRCRLIQNVSAGLTACKAGQERNPETNRCRLVLGSSASLVPCKPGQERNPATNRCRSINSSSSELKPCAAGQERNPETNRCRKTAGGNVKGVSDVKDIASAGIAGNPTWVLAGIGVTGALGYAGYEWRREVLGFLSKFKRS